MSDIVEDFALAAGLGLVVAGFMQRGEASGPVIVGGRSFAFPPLAELSNAVFRFEPTTDARTQIETARAGYTTPRASDDFAGVRALIMRAEAPQGYDQVNGQIAMRHRPEALLGKSLTSMTVGEVLDWQHRIDPFYSTGEAAGAGQIIKETLGSLYKRAGMRRTDLFDVAGQNRLIDQLIREAGGNDWLAGRITAEQFGDRLARTWAGFPVHSRQQGARKIVERGQSYYTAVGSNKATISPGQVIAALTTVSI